MRSLIVLMVISVTRNQSAADGRRFEPGTWQHPLSSCILAGESSATPHSRARVWGDRGGEAKLLQLQAVLLGLLLP